MFKNYFLNMNKGLFAIVAFILVMTPVAEPIAVNAASEVATQIDSIEKIRTKADGEVVTTQGIVTANPDSIGTGSQLSTYIQDETGGINLFAFKKSDIPTLKKGDLVKVTGSIKTYRKLKELVPTEVEVLKSNQALPKAKSITLEEFQDVKKMEQYEGVRVTVTGNARQVPDSPAGGGYNVSFVDKDYNGTTLRVMEDAVDISTIKEGTWYEVTGIVGRHDNFQLIPTEQADIQQAEAQPELPSPAGIYTSTVASVTDGDTIVLENPVIGTTRVRFLNMDTAETYPPRSKDRNRKEINENQKHYGDEATKLMQTLIEPGDEVQLKVNEEGTDAYGRLLAEVIRPHDGLNLNLEMVKEGLAVTYFISPVDYDAFPEYQKAVREAKEQGLGIWNPENPILELPFEFRVNDDGKTFNKFVGNYETKGLFKPTEWEQVPIENRIFFWDEAQANEAGFTIRDGESPTPEPEPTPDPNPEPEPEEPKPTPEPEEPGDDEQTIIVPNQKHGPAKLNKDDIESLKTGQTFVVDLEKNKQKSLLVFYNEVKALKEKEITLIVKSDELEKTYEMKDVRTGTFKVFLGGYQYGSSHGQGHNNYQDYSNKGHYSNKYARQGR